MLNKNKNNTFKWQIIIIIQTDNTMLLVTTICSNKLTNTFENYY